VVRRWEAGINEHLAGLSSFIYRKEGKGNELVRPSARMQPQNNRATAESSFRAHRTFLQADGWVTSTGHTLSTFGGDMKIVLLLGLGCAICGAVQAQASCPPYCSITRVPLGSATQQRLQFLQQRPPAGFATQRFNAVQTPVGNSSFKQIQNPTGFTPMQQSQSQSSAVGFGNAAPMQQSQPQPQAIPNSSGGFANSGAAQPSAFYQQQPSYYQQQPTNYQQQSNYYQQPQQDQQNYYQQSTYYQSQSNYNQTPQDQAIYYQSQQSAPVYGLTCQTQSLLCAAYQSGACSCRSAITGGVEYGSTN
jgi:hypothetical protein